MRYVHHGAFAGGVSRVCTKEVESEVPRARAPSGRNAAHDAVCSQVLPRPARPGHHMRDLPKGGSRGDRSKNEDLLR